MKSLAKKSGFGAVAILCAMFMVQAGMAETIDLGSVSFRQITTNGSVNISAYLSGSFSYNTDSSQVTLHLQNNMTSGASSIANVYLGGGFFNKIVGFNEPTGVLYMTGGEPPALPSAPTGFTTNLEASAKNPKPANGVNPGEYVDIILTLSSGVTYSNLQTAIANHSTFMGLHVISIGAYSESFVNNGHSVPEPSTLLLLGAGLIAVCGSGFARRK